MRVGPTYERRNGASEEQSLRVVCSPLVRRHFQIREAEERGVSAGHGVMTPGDLARRLLSLIPGAPRLATPASELNLLWMVTRRHLGDSPFQISPISLRSFLVNLLATLRQLKQFNLEERSLEKVKRRLDSKYLRGRWAFVASVYLDFEEALSARGLVDEVGVFHYVARHAGQAGWRGLGIRRILLHHLVDMTPAQAVMFRALQDAGVEVRLQLEEIPAVFEPAFENRLRALIGEIETEYVAPAISRENCHIEEVIAPTAAEEARWCARYIRALLRAGVAPHRVLISFRRPTLSPESLRRHFADFNVPLAGNESAASAPAAGRLLFAIADLALNNFPRRSMSLLLDAYRATAGLPPSWLEEVFSLPAEDESGEEDFLAPVIWRGYERWRKRLASVEKAEEAIALLNRIHRLRGKPAREFVDECREIALHLTAASKQFGEGMDEAARNMTFALEIAEASHATEGQTMEILRSLYADPQICGGIEPERVGWGGFADILGMTTDHAILLSVSDAFVPAAPPSPFILTASERRRVNSILDCEVFLNRESHLLRERLFFESAIATGASSILVSRFKMFQNTPQYESPLWRMWKTAFGCRDQAVRIYTMRRSLQPAPRDVESLDDALRSLARVPHPSLPEAIADEARHLDAVTLGDRQRLETRGLVPGFDGVIPRDALSIAVREYGATPSHPATPTGLARYGKCPFVFFCEQVLELASLPEEDAPPTMTLGSLVHRVLERAIQPLIRNEAKWEDFPALTEREAETEFSHSDRLAFRGTLNVVKRSVIRFAEREASEMIAASVGKSGQLRSAAIVPLHAELRLSGAIPLRSGPLYLEGKTDRIDRVDGKPGEWVAFLLNDYKLRTLPDLAKPRRFVQLPLYASLFSGQNSEPVGLNDIGFRYVSVGKPISAPRLSTALKRGLLCQKYAEAKDATEDIVRNIRDGLFTPFPQFGDLNPCQNKPVPDRLRKEKFLCETCSYISVCRISLVSGVRKDLIPFAARSEGADWGWSGSSDEGERLPG